MSEIDKRVDEYMETKIETTQDMMTPMTPSSNNPGSNSKITGGTTVRPRTF